MKWTAQQIPDMSSKVVIVTGANSGLGFEAARMMAAKGATVIMACRDTAKGEATARQIRDEYPQAQLEVMALDLADLSAVGAFADAFLAKYDRLDVLLNNAGVMALPERRATADGFEMQMGVNHLGQFALTGRLLEALCATPGARVVAIASFAHKMGRITFDDLHLERSYSRWPAYGASKLANVLFTYELQRRLAAAGCDASAVVSHPGYTATHLQRYSGVFSFLNRFFAQDVKMGVLPVVYAATAPEVSGGDFIGPDGLWELRGYPTKVESSKASHDRELARRLWEVSEELTGVSYSF